LCVLVVEDEFFIRQMLVEGLQEAGYEVKEAATGDQAAAMLDSIDPPLKILITDIHMPGRISGIDLAVYVRERLPEVPIIYTTGRPDALNDVNLVGYRQAIIRKPYGPQDVIRQMQILLSPQVGG